MTGDNRVSAREGSECVRPLQVLGLNGVAAGGQRADALSCDCAGCGPVPGALWPHGSEGDEPRFPYVERHDDCAAFEGDLEAAEAIRDAVDGIIVLCPMDPWGDDPTRKQPAVYPWPTA